MSLQVLTREDLEQFKSDLISEMKTYFSGNLENGLKKGETNTKWLKSHQVQRMLAISAGTLQNLRINGTIPFTKIGGIIFYSVDDIDQILQNNKRNMPLDGK